jgi:hypothetical protein
MFLNKKNIILYYFYNFYQNKQMLLVNEYITFNNILFH